MNKVFLKGRLVADPQNVALPTGTAVSNFTIAVNEVFSTKEGGKQEHTSFVDVKAYGRLAENIEKFFSKGRMILVEGKLRQEKWEDKDGNKRSKIVVKMETFYFVDSNKKTETDTENQTQDKEDKVPETVPF